MSKQSDCILILWAPGFEAAMATIFATEFRRQGLYVKIIGMTQRRTIGAFGLTLVPDITLEEIHKLKKKPAFVIIPCSENSCHYLMEDPRLSDFFALEDVTQAKFIIGPIKPSELLKFPPQVDKILIDDTNDTEVDLVAIARDLAHSCHVMS